MTAEDAPISELLVGSAAGFGFKSFFDAAAFAKDCIIPPQRTFVPLVPTFPSEGFDMP